MLKKFIPLLLLFALNIESQVNCADTVYLRKALHKDDRYLIATNRGIMRINRLGDSVDRRLISVGDNQIDQIRDNGNGYLLTVRDGCGWSLATPCSIYRASYGLDTVDRVASSPIPVSHRSSELLYSRFDSVFVSTVNGGAYVSHDFMKTWTYITSKDGSCSMDFNTYEYLEHGDSLYLANRSGLFLYKPFERTAGALFCNGPNRYSGLVKKYRDSMIVSDSGYVYRISKLGENLWSRFPLPKEYTSVNSCTFDIFSDYMVFQSQALGCGVGDSVRISVYDLKNRQMVKTFTNAEWKYQISYTTTQDRLFVNLGKAGIAVYDETMTETIYKNSDCVPTQVLPARARKKPGKVGPGKILVDGRRRNSKRQISFPLQ